ncbi:hypothetical protein J6590_012583 [Homalodisca vitripennis]|nr:hypothetical protein J6590_012583 [Homalodisca vitripennis]
MDQLDCAVEIQEVENTRHVPGDMDPAEDNCEITMSNSGEEPQRSIRRKRNIADVRELQCPKGQARDLLGKCRPIMYNKTVSKNINPKEDNSKISEYNSAEQILTTDLIDSSGEDDRDISGTTQTSTSDPIEEPQLTARRKRHFLDGPVFKSLKGQALDFLGICRSVIYKKTMPKSMDRDEDNSEISESNSAETFPTTDSIDASGKDDRDISITSQTSTSYPSEEPQSLELRKRHTLDGPVKKCLNGQARDFLGICRPVLYNENVSKNVGPEEERCTIL